jgi:hypothetical protein
LVVTYTPSTKGLLNGLAVTSKDEGSAVSCGAVSTVISDAVINELGSLEL